MTQFRTYQLAKELFFEAKKLKLKGALRDQMERASLSIVLNLAEGSAKPGFKDRRKFFHIAMGSLRETQAILELTEQKGLLTQLDVLAAHLHKLLQNPGPGPAA